MKKVIIILLTISLTSISKEYIPTSYTEKEVLNKYKNIQLKIGLLNTPPYNNNITKHNPNYIIKDLFYNYLGLKVVFINGSFDNLYNKFSHDKIDVISFISKENQRSKFLDMTQTIFTEKLYVISKKKNINSLKDLHNKNIYVEKNTIYSKFIKTILENNDLNTNIIEVVDVELYKNKYILTPIPVVYNPKSIIEVSNSPGISIGLNKNFKDLVPILDKALNNKYRSIIQKNIINFNEESALNNFYKSLSSEELKYLKKLNKINILYENEYNSLISYYSKKTNSYEGIVPNILKIFKKQLKININDLTTVRKHNIDDLKSKDIDVVVLSKAKKRLEKYIFSKKIYEENLYVIALKNNNFTNRSIGVVKNNIEELIALKYDTYKNLKVYSTFKELVNALNKKEVGNILVTTNNFNPKLYDIKFFEKIPINLALKKEDIILKNILDKGIKYLINKSDLINKSLEEKNKYEHELELKSRNKIKLIITLCILLVILSIIFFIRLLFNEKYKKKMLIDSLTGFSNDLSFNEFLNENKDIKKGYTFVIRINNLKELKENLEIEKYENLIKEFAKFIKLIFKDELIFKINSNRFLILYSDSYESKVKELSFYRVKCLLMSKFNIFISVGIHYKTKYITVKESLKYSELALSRINKIYRFSYKFADDFFVENINRELKILNLLKSDLSGLYPVFQPKLDLNKNTIIGVEALARFKNKDMGVIYPLEFIKIAEEKDLIHKIDYIIAEESIKILKFWIENRLVKTSFRLSFNISVKTFGRKDFIYMIESLIKKYNVSGNYLEIEITESILVKNIKELLYKLKSLKKLGIQISLDDFTAGHSTASLLPILPIDVVKFDMSLLRARKDNKAKAEIVYCNLTKLIKGLNLKIVSEGIEEDEEKTFLKSLKIDYIQGYLIGKPMTSEEILKGIGK